MHMHLANPTHLEEGILPISIEDHQRMELIFVYNPERGVGLHAQGSRLGVADLHTVLLLAGSGSYTGRFYYRLPAVSPHTFFLPLFV